MRRYLKNRCKAILSTLDQAHTETEKLLAEKHPDQVMKLLEECQQVAIAVGNIVEEAEGEGAETVRALEAYCELAYEIHEELSSGKELPARQTKKRLHRSLRDVKNAMDSLPVQTVAVFLPYKASMWDSLESVWMAADADENCTAYVIPIPYFDKRPDGTLAGMHDESALYPENVPITKYDSLNLEALRPDMIFIHNPYDGWNYVTTVHPDFYSDRLKEITDCLVYVPYYATSGVMATANAYLPAYENMDYIVVQSEEMIRQFDVRVPKQKFLPLGSPKFDRVIRMCKNPPEMPVEWKKKAQGKRVYFYNTSINGMLADTPQYLKKMAYVFDTFREARDACILWRPHPLMESTFASLRPELKNEYDRLRQNFLSGDFGIYDDTPDIESSVAFSDAYLGDAGSSVTSLFTVSGKPVYILNYRLPDIPDDDLWKRMIFPSLTSEEKANRFCIIRGKYLFRDIGEGDIHEFRFFTELPGKPGSYGRPILWEEYVICPSVTSEEIRMVHLADKHIEKIPLPHRVKESQAAFRVFYEADGYLYLCPDQYGALVRVDLETREIAFAEVPMEYVKIKTEDGREVFTGFYFRKGKFFFTRSDGNEILITDRKTLESEKREIDVGQLCTHISCFSPEDDVMWFFPYRGTIVTMWDTKTDTFTKYDLRTEGLISVDREKKETRVLCDNFYFSNVAYPEKDRVIISPNWGNQFVQLDLKTGAVSEWISPFQVITEDLNKALTNGGMGGFCWKPGRKSYRYYYAPARRLYDIDLQSGTATEVEIHFNKEEVAPKEAGFCLNEEGTFYCCEESAFNTLKDIITGYISGRQFDLETVEHACARWNASPDGNCGTKVYDRLCQEAG